MSLSQIFSPSMRLIFSFSLYCLSWSRVFNFNEVHLINHFFHGSCLCCSILKDITIPRVTRIFSHVVFQFYTLCFTFRSVIHFELYWVKSVRSRFIFFAYVCPFVPSPFFERLFLLHCIAFAPLSNMSRLFLWRSVSRLTVLFRWLIVLLLIPHCLDYCSFVVALESSSINPPTLFFSFNIVLSMLGLLSFHKNFRIIL